MEGGKEQLDKKEKTREAIDDFLNNYGEYPDTWLSDDEKENYGEKVKAEPKSEFAKRVYEWSHNKYSVTWWIFPALVKVEEAVFFEALIKDEAKQNEIIQKWEALHKRVKEEQANKISEETIKQIEALLREVREAL
ncbi:MAG: hypothetical protein Q8Q46_01370 [Candidatus Giovannonibacteria bacterium]|nr:hypothetical protein [Candidatus Giovannonibacteria bacterium]